MRTGASASTTPDSAQTPRAISIVALAGDGIGPEILAVALAALEAATDAAGVRMMVRRFPAGAAVAARCGNPLADDALQACIEARTILKSPTGSPGARRPDGTETGLASGFLRQRLSLWANLRPVRTLPRVPALARRPVDCVIVRENSEGIYSSRGRTVRTPDAAVDVMLVTRTATARLTRLACRLAQARAGRLVCVDKANVLGSFAFFREVARDTAAQFAGVEFGTIHADAAAAALVERPHEFDVMITENLLGDILSDLAGAVAGGIGLCPSANMGDRAAMFEPIHGSAPDLAGTGRANPLGEVLSAAMLLEWIGEQEAGALIEAAVDDALTSGYLHIEPDGTLREGIAVAERTLPELIHRSSRPALSRQPLLPVDQGALSGTEETPHA